MIATLAGAGIIACIYAALYLLGWVAVRKVWRNDTDFDSVHWVLFPFCGAGLSAVVFIAFTVFHNVGAAVLK